MAKKSASYQILPFQFVRYDDSSVFITNYVGEGLFVCRDDFNKLVSGELEKTHSAYNDLLSKHIICSQAELADVVSLLAVKFRTKKEFLSSFTSLHMIVITLRCNTACVYCHASRKHINAEKSYDMSIDTARKVVDIIFQTPSKHIKIEFQGGEPLLNIDTLKFIVQYAELKNCIACKDLSFVVCTNISLITDDLLHFFKKHKIVISTSLDGTKDIHNRHRPLLSPSSNSGYDVFVDKLHSIFDILGHNSVGAIVTITKYSVSRMREIVDEYIRLGLNGIFIRCLNPYGFARKSLSEIGYDYRTYVENYKDVINYMIQLNINGTKVSESFAVIFLRRMFTPFSTGFVDMQSPAGVGISGAIYDYNGNVYVSDEGRMLSAMGDEKFFMGNVSSNSYNEMFNGEFLRTLIKNTCLEAMPICNECVYMPFCGSDPVIMYLDKSDETLSMHDSEMCKKNKEIFRFFIEKFKNGSKEERNVLMSWVR